MQLGQKPLFLQENANPTLAAVFTPYPQKPMSENAALEVSPHFLRYVPWQLAVCCLQLCQKRLQVARHRPIQGLGFGLATTIRDSGHAAPDCKEQTSSLASEKMPPSSGHWHRCHTTV